jgi:hypothetical protein
MPTFTETWFKASARVYKQTQYQTRVLQYIPHMADSTHSRSSAEADIEPVAEPLGREGLLPGESLGIRLRKPYIGWLGEETALQGRGTSAGELEEAVARAVEPTAADLKTGSVFDAPTAGAEGSVRHIL